MSDSDLTNPKNSDELARRESELGSIPLPENGEELKRKGAFAKARRELTEEEMTSPVVTRLLLDSLDRSEQGLRILDSTRDKCALAEKEKAVLEERLRGNNRSEVLYSLALAVGSIMCGKTFPNSESSGANDTTFVLGILLIVGSALSKLIWRTRR